MPLIVCASNDDGVLDRCLRASPDLADDGRRLHVVRGAVSAGQAYNAALRHAGPNDPYVVFVHQDVYLPAGWFDRLAAAVAELEERGVNWGVLGVWGVREVGGNVGRVWCSGAGRAYDRPAAEATPVASIDEIVIVLKVDPRLRFDENLPGFHFYATDTILRARELGLGAFVFDGPVVHHSRQNPNPLDKWFFRGHRYMRQKWRHCLPLRTCTVPVTRWGWPLYKAWLRRERRRLLSGGRQVPERRSPAEIAAALGYEPAPLPAGGAVGG